jgi:hypothetical protein
MASTFTRFRDHTQRRATVGRTPLGRVISSSQKSLPDNTQNTRQINTHAPGGICFNASFVRILYFVVLVLDLGPLGRCDHLSVLSLVWADVLYPGHQELPSLAREDAAYWPDTQRTPLEKEGINGIWPAIVLLHAPKLEHGTDYFTSPPKEGMLLIFPAGKIRRLRSGANPRSWVPEASMLTTRPPKLLDSNPRSQQASDHRPMP